LFKSNATRTLNASTFLDAGEDIVVKEKIFKKLSDIVNK